MSDIKDLMLKWDTPMTSEQAAKFHLTAGFVPVELHSAEVKKVEDYEKPCRTCEHYWFDKIYNEHKCWWKDIIVEPTAKRCRAWEEKHVPRERDCSYQRAQGSTDVCGMRNS